jgi:L-histidine N-alpha-methyltransferase
VSERGGEAMSSEQCVISIPERPAIEPIEPNIEANIEANIEPNIEIELREGPARDEPDRAELRQALLRTPREIPSKFFYDDLGSELFERITELPEYYPTRTERALLAAIAGRVIERTGAEELVEIGSGAATKTRLLLDAMQRAGKLRLYVPFDVAESTVVRVAEELTAEYPGLAVHGVVGDFMTDLGRLPEGGPRLLIFLGGTIGNLRPAEARRFMDRLARATAPGDWFLLGVDLVKPIDRLEVAYDDAAGVTAEFNRNVLRVVNRLTQGNFDPEAFRHRAFYDRENRWIEMRLVALAPQRVSLPGIGLDFDLAQGEEIRTEISAKYDRATAEALLAASGFELAEWFTDPEELFGLALARRAEA